MKNRRRSNKSERSPRKVFGPGFFTFIFFTLILNTLAFILSAHAAKIYPSEGSASAAFLEIGAGARAVGMAGAYTAVADDAYAMYWNPAGLSLLKDRNLAFTHNDYFAGLSQEYAAYSMPAPRLGLLPAGVVTNGVMGVSLDYLYYGNNLERRSGNYEGGNNLSPVEGKFGAYDMAFEFGYGGILAPGLRAGAALKFIQQSIDSKYGNSAALDLGALYDFNWQGRAFTAGFAVQNLGPGIKFEERRYPLPLTGRAGLSTRLYGNSLLLSLDLSKPIDNYPSLALGVEQRFGEKLFMRAGYSYREYGNEAGGLSGLALGFGFVSGPFSVDYAFSPFGDLGNTQRFSAALRFSGPEAREKARPDKDQPKAPLLAGRALRFRLEEKPLSISRGGTISTVRAEVVDDRITAAESQAGIKESSLPGQTTSLAVVSSSDTVAVVALSTTAAAAAPVISSAPALSGGNIEGVSLRSLSFAVLKRGQGEVSVDVTEGELPKAMLEKFPAAAGPLAAWQLAARPLGLKGEILLEFEAGNAPGPGGPFLYYFAGNAWKKGEPKSGHCGERTCTYSVSVPYSQYYAVAVK